MEQATLKLLRQVAHGIAQEFGSSCEVVIHELNRERIESSIVGIENGQVTYRKVGDGPSQVVLEALHGDHSHLPDKLGYLTRASDGRILKSSTIYVHGEADKVEAILSINYDITTLLMANRALRGLISTEKSEEKDPPRISQNVTDLLDDLIDQSVQLVDKPVAMMNKEDKVKAIRFLNDHGAFLVTKSGDKIARHFGISKYTLYSYLDAAQQLEGNEKQSS